MRNFFLAAVCGLALLQNSACQKSAGTKTEMGNTFTNHTNGTGHKLMAGEMANVNMWLYANDSLLQSTQRDQGGPVDIVVPKKETLTKQLMAYNEALLMMAVGDSATIVQPVDSMMAANLKARLGMDVKTFRFEIKVLSVKDTAYVAGEARKNEARMQVLQGKMAAAKANAGPYKARSAEVKALIAKTLADYKAGSLGAKLTKSGSGLEIVILEPGTGENFKKGEPALTSYYGVLKADGTMFDNSFDRGEPMPFTIGQLVPGFNEGMMMLKPGGKAVLFIPSALGYGARDAGKIPPNSDLVFYVECD